MEDTSDFPSPFSPTFLAVISTSYVLVMVASLAGNLLICITIYKNKVLLKSPCYYFILSLALSDLGTTLFAMPFDLEQVLTNGKWTHSHHLCNVWTTAYLVTVPTSILHLLTLSIERYKTLNDPLDRYKESPFLTVKRAMLVIVVIWAYSFVFALIPVMGWRAFPQSNAVTEVCGFNISPAYSALSSVLNFFLPMFVMCLVYYKIYTIANKQRKVPLLRPSDKSHDKERVVRPRSYSSQALISSNKLNEVYSQQNKSDGRHTRRCSLANQTEQRANLLQSTEEVPMMNNQLVCPSCSAISSLKTAMSSRVEEKESDLHGPGSSGASPSSTPMSSEGEEKESDLHGPGSSGASPSSTPMSSEGEEKKRDLHGPGSSGAFPSSTPMSSEGEEKKRDLHGPGSSGAFPSSAPMSPREHRRDRVHSVGARISSNMSTYIAARSRKLKVFLRDTRAARTIALIVCSFFCCWMPHTVFSFVSVCCRACGSAAPEELQCVLLLLGYLSSAINPYLYSCQVSDMRRAYRELYNSACPCARRATRVSALRRLLAEASGYTINIIGVGANRGSIVTLATIRRMSQY